MTEALEPCPFCGEAAEISQHGDKAAGVRVSVPTTTTKGTGDE